MKTEGSVIAVSGGASGLGAATCRYLLEQGARGVIAVDSDEERGKQLRSELGENCLFTPVDVANEHDFERDCIGT